MKVGVVEKGKGACLQWDVNTGESAAGCNGCKCEISEPGSHRDGKPVSNPGTALNHSEP